MSPDSRLSATPHIIGIDPGKSGALAALTEQGDLIAVVDMPTLANKLNAWLLADAIEQLGNAVDVTAIVEDVHSMPKQGISSAFDFGKSYGMVLGALAAIGIRTELVSPSAWKKTMGLTVPKGADKRLAKEMSRSAAIERWPAHRELFARVKDADRAEAALLALWWLNRKGA
jgi:crossover junction endodeoxyribonuclease RuvC